MMKNRLDKRSLLSLGLLVAPYLFVILSCIHDGSCACPTVDDIELLSDAIFDEDGSLSGEANTHVARLGDTVIFTCNIQATDLSWVGSVVGGVSDFILFNSSVMPGTSAAEEIRREGAVIGTLTEMTTECRTSTLSVDTLRVNQIEMVECQNDAQNPTVTNRLESFEPPPSPNNTTLSPDTCTSVGVEWTEPESDLTITNYTITVTNLGTGNDLPLITGTGNTTTLTGLMVGVNYRVEIVSNDVIGPGGSANENFVINSLIPPTNVEYQLECRTSTQAQITWQLPTQGPLTPPPTAVRVCWQENGGAEQCSVDLPPDTTMYNVTTTPNSEYTVRVEIDNGCSTEGSSLDDSFDATVIQDVTVTAPSMGAVGFTMEFAQCVEDTTNWDVELSYEPITGMCPGNSTTFDYPVDLTQQEVFNDVNCTRNYAYTVTVTDESGTQVGEANAGMFDTNALPSDCDPNDLGGTVDNDIDSRCAAGSMGSASIPNGVVCYDGVIVQSEAHYICDTGYEVAQGATNPRVCQTNGMWTGSVITCVEVTTAPPTPPPPSPTSDDDNTTIIIIVVIVILVVVGGFVVNLLLIVLLHLVLLPCCLVKPSEADTARASASGVSDDERKEYKIHTCILILLVALVVTLPFVIYFYCCWHKKSGSSKTDDKVELNVRTGSESGDIQSSPEATDGGDLNYAVPGDIKREEFPGTHQEYTVVDKSRKKPKPEDTKPTYAAPDTIPREKAPATGDLYTVPDKPKKGSRRQAPGVPPPEEPAPVYSEVDKSKKQPGIVYADVELPGSNTTPARPPRVDYSSVQY